MTPRLPDWESRLHRWIDGAHHRRFEWGRFDCALMVADAVQAMTGIDPAADLRGKYRTPIGAARVIKRNGGLDTLCDTRIGDRIALPFATFGDVGLAQAGRVQTLTLCAGPHWYVAGSHGIRMAEPDEIKLVLAWRIPQCRR